MFATPGNADKGRCRATLDDATLHAVHTAGTTHLIGGTASTTRQAHTHARRWHEEMCLWPRGFISPAGVSSAGSWWSAMAFSGMSTARAMASLSHGHSPAARSNEPMILSLALRLEEAWCHRGDAAVQSRPTRLQTWCLIYGGVGARLGSGSAHSRRVAKMVRPNMAATVATVSVQRVQ